MSPSVFSILTLKDCQLSLFKGSFKPRFIACVACACVEKINASREDAGIIYRKCKGDILEKKTKITEN